MTSDHEAGSIKARSNGFTRRTVVAAASGVSALTMMGVIGVPRAFAAPTASDFATLRTRHKNMLTGGSGYTPTAQPFAGLLSALDSAVAGYLSTLNTAAGRTYLWNDPASSTGSANMTVCFVRLRAMAIQYASVGSSYQGNTSLRDTIVGGLQWLSDNEYNSSASRVGNRWDWDIGSPMAALDALIVMDSNIPAALNSTLLGAVDHFVSTATWRTGANLAWVTRSELLHSIAAESTSKFAAAQSDLLSMMADVASGDGFHTDGSFIQHSIHPYTGGYGVEMFYQLSWMVYLLGGPSSTWVTPSNWSIMMDWAWDAYEPLLFRGAISGAVLGRNISRNYSTDHYAGATFLSAALLLSAVASSSDAAALKSLFRTQVLADTARDFFTYDPITGIGNMTMYIASYGWTTRNDTSIPSRDELNATIIYPQMDRIVHRKPGWSYGVANFSTRIGNYESINSENLRGWYAGNGMTYFFTQYDLDHYQDDFWCTVDPYRLAGTTVDKRPRANGVAQSSTAQTPMVGGVSDQNCGVGVYTINRDSGSMKAQKSWIFIGDYIVCQGSAITNTSSYGVETIIDNRNIGASGTNGVQMNTTTTPVIDTLGVEEVLGANWLHVDGVGGYLFPGSNPVIHGLRSSRSGRWSDINSRTQTPTDTRTRRYLTLWFDHGTTPTNANYGYIFMPNATASATGTAWSANQIQRQVTNSAHYAFANFSTLDVHGAVFWASSSIGIFTASAPIAVIVRVTNGHISITVSDPTQTQTSPITLTVNLPNSGVSSLYSSLTATRTATSATLTFSPSGLKGAGARAVLNV
jgi:hyaluronate lyase